MTNGIMYKQRETSKVAEPMFSTGEMITNSPQSKQDVVKLKQEANQEKQAAISTYSQSMSILASQNMTKAFPAFNSDPVALKSELEKVKAEMMKTIPDQEMRVNFAADYELKSSSYINKAQANFDTVQYKKRKSAIFNSITSNDEAVGLAFTNALSGTANGDDYVNYRRAIATNKSLINAKNPDGSYMFSDQERLSLTKNVNKQVMDNFLGSLHDMEDYKRKGFMNKLKNDEVVLLKIENDKGSHNIRLQDSVDPAVYRDMKRRAEELDVKIRKQEVASFNLMRSEANIGFLRDPTEQGLEELKALYPEASEAKIKGWEKALSTRINQDAATTFESYSDAMNIYKEIANMPVDNPEEMVALMNRADNFLLSVRQGNADGKISVDDLDSINSDIQKMLNDNVFQEQIKNLPDLSIFTRIGETVKRADILNNPFRDGYEDYENINKNNIPIDTQLNPDDRNAYEKFADNVKGVLAPLKSKLDNRTEWFKKQGLKTIKNMLEIMRQGGEIEVNGKVVTANDVYNKGVQEAIRYKYSFIPELQGELIPGESVISINGINYIFQGYNQRDILIEEAK